jgi:mannose-1-phosphate guanylyltransferase
MGDRYIVIMAGGRGERFWPVSRARRPKHLLPIVGDQPMLRQTLDRLHGLIEAENVFIITSSEQRDAVLEICPDVPEVQVIGEPVGRNTAAAIGLATILIRGRNPDSCFAVLHSDHVIKDKAAFRSDLELAFDVAMRKNALVTLGIHPNYPATGYGYIQAGAAATDFSGDRVFAVNGFVEKPILAVAEEYVASGKYLWNAGMFVWRTSVIARQFARFEPKLWSAAPGCSTKFSRTVIHSLRGSRSITR